MASKYEIAEEVVSELPYEERSALAFGFPIPETSEFVSNFVNASGEGDEEYSTDVNGNWKPLNESLMSDFDGGFDFTDDDFDNFLTKKARARNKKKKELKKQNRDSGMSRRDARKSAKKQALKEIPRDSLKTIAKNTIKKVGRAIKVGALVVPRASFLSLMMINFRGFAWKFNEVMTNPKYSKKLAQLKEKWNKLGGNWNNNKFQNAINRGKSKKPFFCGKKCKKKLADGNIKRSFDGNVEFYNAGGVDDVAVGVWIGLGASVIGALGGIATAVITKKSKEQEIQASKNIAEKELATLSESEKRRIALAEKKLIQEGDPIRQIQNNPNLTAQQKADAIKQVQEATEKTNTSNLKKYALIGGLALVGVLVLLKVVKK